jgi:hypothetical protein
MTGGDPVRVDILIVMIARLDLRLGDRPIRGGNRSGGAEQCYIQQQAKTSL